MSPLLRLYLAASHLTGPLWWLAHRRRLSRGKEIEARLGEKYGRAPTARPEGEVLWFHALSVGEALALIPLIEQAVAERECHVVLTTSTATSAAAIARAGLPKRALHVFQPIDTPRAVRRFLDHWTPSLACFAELDFWPRLMVETKRRDIPMALVNARLPEDNFQRRQKLGGFFTDILRLFDLMLVQDADSFERFRRMGAEPKKMRVTGPLKAAARALPKPPETDAVLAGLAERPVWLAAATHQSEHPAVIEAHRRVLEKKPDALLIVAPRHVADGAALAEMARLRFERVAMRSGGGPITDAQVYIADTIGEMGLWYRVSPISFVGHSLGDETLSGKNPFEAAALGSAILHGPHIDYFSESYSSLARHGAVRPVGSAEELAEAVIRLLDDTERQPMIDGARATIREGRTILDNSWRSLATLLD